ncbi:MAG: HlyC/CorC family transporter [Bacteroidetes bacterium]|nr:MAG: HlyC/CorC family transporter [Bacteroidota bacterium]
MANEILIILALTLINGLFSMSEIALVSARKSRLENLARKGDTQARMALTLAGNPNRFLSTVQIGITLIGILTGLYGGQTLQDNLKTWFDGFPVLTAYSNTLSSTVIVVGITFVSLVIGELLPKRIGLTRPEAIARAVAIPMNLLARASAPFVWLLTGTTGLFIRLLNIKPGSDSQVTEEEIKAIVQEGADSGTVDEIEQDIVERVFHLGDLRVANLMTHRRDVVWFNLQLPVAENMKHVVKEKHSVYPVADGDLDKIEGFIHIKDLYFLQQEPLAELDYRSVMRPALYVLESMNVYNVLERFKETRIHQAVVIDEFGSFKGLATINDILEALVGDISDAPQDEYQITEREDGTALVDGQIAIFDFINYFELQDYMDELKQYHTIAGFLLDHFQHIPHAGEKLTWKHISFEVLDMDGNRIDKVMVANPKKAE